MYEPATAWYVGKDGPDKPATTCEVCGEQTEAATLAPCGAGNGLNPCRHVACPVCWRALLAHALLHGGQGAASWLN